VLFMCETPSRSSAGPFSLPVWVSINLNKFIVTQLYGTWLSYMGRDSVIWDVITDRKKEQGNSAKTISKGKFLEGQRRWIGWLFNKSGANHTQNDAGVLHCWGHLGFSGRPPLIPRNPLLLADVPVCHHRQVLQDEG